MRIKSYYEGKEDMRKAIEQIILESIAESESMAGIAYPYKAKQLLEKIAEIK